MTDINNNNLKEEIGKRINRIRIQNGFSKEKFAKSIDVTGQHLGKVISGECGLSIEKIIELSLKFEVPTDFILLGKESSIDESIKEKLNNSEYKIQEIHEEIKNIINLL